MSRNIIRDGFTRDGYVAERPGIHGDLRFRYRPMLPEVVERIEEAIAKRTGPQAVAEIAKETAVHLVEWSEEDEAGGAVPISESVVRRLPHGLFNRVYRIIAGHVPSDDEGRTYRETRLLETAEKN